LKKKHISFLCDFIGGECPEQSADKFASLIKEKGLADCVFYHGRKYGKDKNEYYRKADVFVFPTFYPAECFPLVLLEAMQYGLPCISTTEAAIPDIVRDGENGILVEYTEKPQTFASHIADAIQWMSEHPTERMEMGFVGRKTYERRFSDKKFETCIIQNIKKLRFKCQTNIKFILRH